MSRAETALKRFLLPTETIVIEVRRHWAEIFLPAVAVFVGLVVALLLDTVMPLAPPVRLIMWLAWASVLGLFLWRILDWSMDWFVVTDKRFVRTWGVLTRQVGMMPLTRVTDMRYERPALGRLFGYGTFVLESAGQDQALHLIEFLPDPEELYKEVCELLFNPPG
ncbi:MAG TPA: PH domain-containing protein [Propionibacteriaceae bacterium]